MDHKPSSPEDRGGSAGGHRRAGPRLLRERRRTPTRVPQGLSARSPAYRRGPLESGVPQVADRPEPFVSRVRPGLAGRTAALEQLAVEMYARGLSTRDIEAAFRDASGRSVLSRTAVSQMTERLWQEYEAFAGRDLSEFAVAYLFVDGVAERLHAGLPREAVLCAWGITEDGQKVLLHLAPDPRRGDVLPAGPAPAVPGPSAAQSAKQGAGEPVAGDRRPGSRVLRGGVAGPGRRAARRRRGRVRARLPSGRAVLSDDFEACIAHRRFPLRHRRVIRTTNLLERLFLEERRRTKIIPHAFGERPALKLMYAAVIRAADRWRGIQVGKFEQRQLRAIRDELNRAHAQRVAPAVTRATTPVVHKLRKRAPGHGKRGP